MADQSTATKIVEPNSGVSAQVSGPLVKGSPSFYFQHDFPATKLQPKLIGRPEAGMEKQNCSYHYVNGKPILRGFCFPELITDWVELRVGGIRPTGVLDNLGCTSRSSIGGSTHSGSLGEIETIQTRATGEETSDFGGVVGAFASSSAPIGASGHASAGELYGKGESWRDDDDVYKTCSTQCNYSASIFAGSLCVYYFAGSIRHKDTVKLSVKVTYRYNQPSITFNEGYGAGSSLLVVHDQVSSLTQRVGMPDVKVGKSSGEFILDLGEHPSHLSHSKCISVQMQQSASINSGHGGYALGTATASANFGLYDGSVRMEMIIK